MSKSEKFLNELQSIIGDDYIDINSSVFIDGETSIHLNNILELIKHNRFGDLNSYLNDEILYTPNKNYTYKIRDKITDEILSHKIFIKDIENDD